MAIRGLSRLTEPPVATGVRVAIVVRDLMSASRIESQVTRANGTMARFDGPAELPPAADVELVVVDWGDRQADWGATLKAWRGSVDSGRRPRIVLFGPHTDLDGHAAARAAGLGPVQARSAFFGGIPRLMEAAARD
jgi:hypothetical protein